MTKYFQATSQEPSIPGMVVAVQTFSSSSLRWNPHLHALVSEGGWCHNGDFLPLPFFHDDTLAELFRHEVFQMLLGKQRITPTTVETMLTWRYHGGFSVHSQTRLSASDRDGVQQLARYIARNPVSQENLSVTEHGMLLYGSGKSRHPGHQRQETLHPLEFLARACLP